MEEKLREIAVRWRKLSDRKHAQSQETGDRYSMGLSAAYATVADELLAHIEQLERAQPAAPAPEKIVCGSCHGVGCGACNNGYVYFEATAQPVAAQGTDGLRDQILSILKRVNFGAKDRLTWGEAKGELDKVIASHDAALIARTREETLKEAESIIRIAVHEMCSWEHGSWLEGPKAFQNCVVARFAALAHTEKDSQPHELGCSALAALNPEERVCDCRAAQQTEGKQP